MPPGAEQASNSPVPESFHIRFIYDSTPGEEHVVGSGLSQKVLDPREEGHMCPREHGHSHHVHVLLKGGMGGRGNARFSTPTNRTPTNGLNR